MSTFVNRGGRCSSITASATRRSRRSTPSDYYSRSREANGGAEAVRQWSRLFLVPGMGHCAGGSLTTASFDLLTALVDWVERGVPPDAVAATRSGEPRLSRPLCACPALRPLLGQRRSNDAAISSAVP